MRSEQYGSVKVSYFDKEAAWLAVEQVALEVGKRPEVKRVAVFGSLVRGEAVPGSDVDVLVVVSETDIPFLDRPNAYRPEHMSISLDVFVYTEVEVAQMLADGNGFIKRALSEGRTLFER